MHIDATDYAILRTLDRDVRTSVTAIAKTARISKEKAHYRIKRLEERGVITGYWGQQRIGRTTPGYKIYLKDKSLGAQKEALITFLLAHKQAAWVAETTGAWDVVVSSFVRNDHEFISFTQALLARFGSHLREKEITKMTKAISLNEKYLHETPYIHVSEDAFTQELPERDPTDIAIINAIAKDARTTYTELARTTGLTPEATRHRYKKLQQENAFVALKPRINHKALGFTYYHILLRLEDYGTQEQLIPYYSQHPNCVYIMTHLGTYDMHLEVVIQKDAFAQFITDLSERFGKALAAYDTLEIIKEHRLTLQQ